MDVAITHVTSRGNNRAEIFLDDLDYATFLTMAAEVVVSRRWLCHAYCVMPNHFHLLVEHPELDLGRGMKLLNGRYARRFNVRHGRVGHVFEARYHAEPVERDEHLLEAARYVVLNPVRAGLRADPADWPWSSWHATARGRDSFVATETLWEMCGGPRGFCRFGEEALQHRQQV